MHTQQEYNNWNRQDLEKNENWSINNLRNIIVANIKNGWFESDCDKGTTLVTGSINHCPAPVATQIETTTRTTEIAFDISSQVFIFEQRVTYFAILLWRAVNMR